MKQFDYEKAAAEAGISGEKLDEICRALRPEFPGDDMMYELHVLRACMAVRDGHVTLEQVLRPPAAAKA